MSHSRRQLRTQSARICPLLLSPSCPVSHNFSWYSTGYLCVQSQRPTKSTKCAYRPSLHSFACSKMFLSIQICSFLLLLGRNPACSFRSFLSTPFLVRVNSILQKLRKYRCFAIANSKVATSETMNLVGAELLNFVLGFAFWLAVLTMWFRSLQHRLEFPTYLGQVGDLSV